MFWDYGRILMSDWGVHLLDSGVWAGDRMTPPEKVPVYGANTYQKAMSRETFDSMPVVFPKDEIAINRDLTAGVENRPFGSLYGIAFTGDDATLVMDRTKMKIIPEYDKVSKKPKIPEYSFSSGKESHSINVLNFIHRIRNGASPACPPET